MTDFNSLSLFRTSPLNVLLLLIVCTFSVACASNIQAESLDVHRFAINQSSRADFADVFSGSVAVRRIENGLMIAVDSSEGIEARRRTFFFMAESLSERPLIDQSYFEPHGSVISKAKLLEVALPDNGLFLRLGLAPPGAEELARLQVSESAYLSPLGEEQLELTKRRYGVERVLEITDGYEISHIPSSTRPAAEELMAMAAPTLADDVLPEFRGPFQDYPDFPNGDGVSCQSGGTGSTACSVGCGDGCSASCGSGYYACCNCSPLSCRCHSNP